MPFVLRRLPIVSLVKQAELRIPMGQLSGLAWGAQLQRPLRLCRDLRTVSSTLVTVPATRGYAVYGDISYCIQSLYNYHM
jgi:hypothetical protein